MSAGPHSVGRKPVLAAKFFHLLLSAGPLPLLQNQRTHLNLVNQMSLLNISKHPKQTKSP
jgi:hypothetical protein